MAAIKALSGWSFTYSDSGAGLPPPEKICEAFEKIGVSRYAFQSERGEIAGKAHLQGSVVFLKPIKGGTLRDLIRSKTRKFYNGGCFHYSPTSDLSKSEIYSCKKETRIDGPWVFPKDQYCGQDLLNEDEYYPWQTYLFDVLVNQDPHPRTIHVIVDPVGNSGKSVFTKGLAFSHDACVMPLGLSSSQMKSALVNAGPKRIYVIDLPRNNKSYTDTFDCVEEIKRGFITSPFYGKLTQLFMSRPHVVLFANEMPMVSLLSIDMWKIFTLDDEMRLVEHDTYEIHEAQKSHKFRSRTGSLTNSGKSLKELYNNSDMNLENGFIDF
jgi:hypothetical protein